MAIKSHLDVKQLEATNYPKLMVNHTTKIIVLFTSPGSGIKVYSPLPKGEIGQPSMIWKEDNFRDYSGTVVLSNK